MPSGKLMPPPPSWTESSEGVLFLRHEGVKQSSISVEIKPKFEVKNAYHYICGCVNNIGQKHANGCE